MPEARRNFEVGEPDDAGDYVRDIATQARDRGPWGSGMRYNYQSDPVLGPVLRYWFDKRGARLMPSRRDIDPVEIEPRLLPNLQITELVDGGARFRYRLAGTAIVEAY